MGYCAHEALGEVSLGALGQASPEKDIEELRLRLVQEAEENFKREAKKLCGEDGEVVSYHPVVEKVEFKSLQQQQQQQPQPQPQQQQRRLRCLHHQVLDQ